MVKRNIVGKIQMRSDTAEAWASKNPILDVGEIGYDTTNKRTKIGDGVTTWDKLELFATKPTPNFATDSWEQINEYVINGTANTAYNIGDEKIIELTTGEQIPLVILGFNHDNKTEGGKANITIGMKGLLQDFYKWNSNHTIGNTGGWEDSLIRAAVSNKFSQLPTNLQSIIKTVEKKTSAGSRSTDIIISNDKLWLLSVAEIFSNTAISNSKNTSIQNNSQTYNAEGEQYEYWKNTIGNHDPGKYSTLLRKQRNTGSNGSWYLRSSYLDSSAEAYVISDIGFLAKDVVSNGGAISFCFCV